MINYLFLDYIKTQQLGNVSVYNLRNSFYFFVVFLFCLRGGEGVVVLSFFCLFSFNLTRLLTKIDYVFLVNNK